MNRIIDRRARLGAVAPWVSTAARLGLAGVFIAAGLLKVVDPQSSVQAVRGYELLPPTLETAVGWGLPFAELGLGLLLAAGVFTRVVGALSAGLLLVFIGAVISAAARGLTIDCGCFGGGGLVAIGETDYGREIARDTGFLLLAVWLIWQPRSRLSLERTDPEEIT
ncbi:MAG TPA: MauE/DoxX family redox-associated membrane protein [Propionibacteriaceae bacterium]|nr:MauE/DoxX family redox-associated membrane protein [Propionibacteriaceae bacterium]